MSRRGPYSSPRGSRTGDSFWRFVHEREREREGEREAPLATGHEYEHKPSGADAADAADERDTGACWEWQGSRDLCGYGRFSMGGRTVLAHRHAWQLVNGAIPDGHVIWHNCGNFACVRPDHLEALPRSEQRLRSIRATTPERFWRRVEKLPDPPLSTANASLLSEPIQPSAPTGEETGEKTGEETGEALPQGLGGCWNWLGPVSSWGYGTLTVRGRHASAHRYAYTITYGALPDDVELLHRCGNPRCVRPDHLTPATRKDISQHHWQAVTHCANGHPRTPENLYTTPTGVQLCRLCHNARMRRYQAKRREQRRAAASDVREAPGEATLATPSAGTRARARRAASTR